MRRIENKGDTLSQTRQHGNKDRTTLYSVHCHQITETNDFTQQGCRHSSRLAVPAMNAYQLYTPMPLPINGHYTHYTKVQETQRTREAAVLGVDRSVAVLEVEERRRPGELNGEEALWYGPLLLLLSYVQFVVRVVLRHSRSALSVAEVLAPTQQRLGIMQLHGATASWSFQTKLINFSTSSN